jgi:predicted O-methyltransferase YrrM
MTPQAAGSGGPAASQEPAPTPERWNAVDEYISSLLVRSDPALEAAISSSDAAGLPAIQVSPTHGKLLHLMARMVGSKKILEIGTLGGYSTIWLGRALPADGKLITLEMDPKHAEVARANLARAGLSERVEIRVGAALDLLPRLAAEKAGPFDLIFIDADKPNIPEYFEHSRWMARRGSVIVVDNVVRNGGVIDAKSEDAAIQGVRRFNDLVARTPGVSATAIQTVGLKGYDGFAVVLVTEQP